jgi:hypothetical protein
MRRRKRGNGHFEYYIIRNFISNKAICYGTDKDVHVLTHHIMKTYGELEVTFHAFSNLELDGASCSRNF